MFKARFLTVFWTLVIAIPLTALALSLAALLTESMSEMAAAVDTVSRATTIGGRGWIVEISERWPEVAGMIVGQLVIMAILLFVRRSKMSEDEQKA
jgi:hypothetical protein